MHSPHLSGCGRRAQPLSQGVALVGTLATGKSDRSGLGRQYKIHIDRALMSSDSTKGLVFVFRWCRPPSFSSALLFLWTLCSATARSVVPNWICIRHPLRAVMIKLIDFSPPLVLELCRLGQHSVTDSYSQLLTGRFQTGSLLLSHTPTPSRPSRQVSTTELYQPYFLSLMT